MLRRDLLALAALFPAAALAQPARAPAGPPPPLPIAPPESIGLVPPRLKQVTEVLAAAVAEGRISGAVLGIARQGKLGWLQAVGFRDSEQTERLRPDAVFPLGAMTEVATAVAALVLVERGRLKLTDPVNALLPAFRELRVTAEGEAEPARVRRPVTIQDLLRHTAGLTFPAAAGQPQIDQPLGDQSLGDQSLGERVETLAKQPLARQPGTLWEHSPAADVLARVIEIASGQPFDRFLAREVTGPLRMADTGFTATPARLARPRLDPLTGALPPHPLTATPGGSTGLFATAGDWLRFGQAMLAGGVLDGARVLGGGTVAHMTSDHLGRIPHDSPSGQALLGDGRGFGLGVSVRLGNGVNAMPGSAGDWDWHGAYGSQFVVDPVRDMVAVLMLNQANQFDHFFRLFRTLVYQTLAK